MNKLFQILEGIQDTEAMLTRLVEAPPDVRSSNSFAINFKSVQKRRENLESEFLQLTERQQLDVCSYRLFPAEERPVKVSWLANALTDFQAWFTVVFDSIKNGPKERARYDADTVSETSFDFGYSFHGSVGMVFTMPNEKLLFGETDLDKTFLAINEMAQAQNSEQIAKLAKQFGIASIRKLYQWTNDHVQSGLGADIQWRRGETVKSKLFIQQPALERLKEAILATSEETQQEIEISGKLVGLDVTLHRFHLETEDGLDMRGQTSPKIGTKETLEVPKRYHAVINVKRKVHYATDKEDVEYFLLDVKEAKT